LSRTDIVTSAARPSGPVCSTAVTLPTSTPATRTGEPALMPLLSRKAARIS
jgi:hypothetical protein